MNRITLLLKWTFKACRILVMIAVIWKALNMSLIFSVAGMTTIVVLLALLMAFAVFDVYKVGLSLIENQK